MSTLREIYEQDAGRKFPFMVKWVTSRSVQMVLGFGAGGSTFVVEDFKGNLTRKDPDDKGWDFMPPPKPKVMRAEWFQNFHGELYRSPFVTDGEAMERGYLRKIPGTEMEFEE